MSAAWDESGQPQHGGTAGNKRNKNSRLDTGLSLLSDGSIDSAGHVWPTD